MQVLFEGLDHLDMQDQINDTITVDEYAAKIGDDADIVTITFTVRSRLAANDLVTWFERGYDWVLDASVSDGELDNGRWLVFVEMNRRTNSAEHIVQLLSDLETLTDRKLPDWKVDIEGDLVAADTKAILNKMILNPNKYRDLRGDDDDEDTKQFDKKEPEDTELNEFRELAGLDVKAVYEEDEYIKNLKAMAGM